MFLTYVIRRSKSQVKRYDVAYYDHTVSDGIVSSCTNVQPGHVHNISFDICFQKLSKSLLMMNAWILVLVARFRSVYAVVQADLNLGVDDVL